MAVAQCKDCGKPWAEHPLVPVPCNAALRERITKLEGENKKLRAALLIPIDDTFATRPR